MLQKASLYLLVATFIGFFAQAQAQTCSGSLTVTLTGSASGTALAAPTGTASQTFCQGATVANLTATPITGATIAWYSAASGGTALTSGTALATGNYYAAQILTSTSCESVSRFTVAVTVTPTNTAGAASSSPTLCINTALTAITHATTGATGIGTATGLPAGVTAAWASNVITISGTPTVAGTFNYSIPLTGGCGTVNATGTIIVDPASVGGTVAGSATVCTTTNSTTLTLSGNTGTVVRWESATTSDFSGTVTSISNTTTTLTATNLTATTYYRAVVQSGTCASANSATGTVTLNPAILAGSCTVANDACQLSAGQIRIEVSGGTTPYTLTATGKAVSPNPSAPTVSAVTAPTGTVSGAVTSYLFNGLAGNVEYKFKVTDNKGCIVGETH
jgi:hypothetical protein